MTLTWVTSRLTMADSADRMPDTNLDGSIMNWESMMKTPQSLKSRAWRWSTSCLITGMWVYSSIWPAEVNTTILTVKAKVNTCIVAVVEHLRKWHIPEIKVAVGSLMSEALLSLAMNCKTKTTQSPAIYVSSLQLFISQSDPIPSFHQLKPTAPGSSSVLPLAWI